MPVLWSCPLMGDWRNRQFQRPFEFQELVFQASSSIYLRNTSEYCDRRDGNFTGSYPGSWYLGRNTEVSLAMRSYFTKKPLLHSLCNYFLWLKTNKTLLFPTYFHYWIGMVERLNCHFHPLVIVLLSEATEEVSNSLHILSINYMYGDFI